MPSLMCTKRCIRKAMKWLSPIFDVTHFELYTTRWVYLTLGTKGLRAFRNVTMRSGKYLMNYVVSHP